MNKNKAKRSLLEEMDPASVLVVSADPVDLLLLVYGSYVQRLTKAFVLVPDHCESVGPLVKSRTSLVRLVRTKMFVLRAIPAVHDMVS